MANELKRIPQPPMPALFQVTAPPNIKPRRKGPIGGVLDHFTQQAERKYYEHVAIVSELQAKAAASMAATQMEAITFGSRVRDALDAYEHASKLRALERETQQANLETIKLNNQDRWYEVQLTRLDYEKKLKDHENGQD